MNLKLWLANLFTPSVKQTLSIFQEQINELERRKRINEEIRQRNHDKILALKLKNGALVNEETKAEESITVLKKITEGESC